MKLQLKALLGLSLVAGATSTAVAQPNVGSVTDIEVPSVVLDTGADAEKAGNDESLDLANIVQSAAKGVTTVQEAPAIVTVITADEIKERQFTNLAEIYDLVPGWQRIGYPHNDTDMPLARGQNQAVLFLQDGVSMFDPFTNLSATGRQQPLELVKRIEMVTGPGGVLWGANSLLGILNVISKDAEDVDGVEVGGYAGTGNGDRSSGHAYVMGGKSDLAGGKVKAFAHASVDTYQGTREQLPLLIFHDPLPQPNSANVYGPLTGSDQQRSLIVQLDGKLSFDKFQLRVQFPFGKRAIPAGLTGNPSQQNVPEDARCAGMVNDPTCVDPKGTSKSNVANLYDRFAVLEYRTRFAGDKAGLTARVYGQEFVRGFKPLQVLAPSVLLQGGLSFDVDFQSYRVGTAVDGDVELTRQIRLLYGGEAFHEWKPDDSAVGNISHLPSPLILSLLPILCPREWDPTQNKLAPVANCPLTFAFPASRSVFGGYLDAQYRPNKKLIFDLGGRLQVAPAAFGELSYPVNPTVGGTVVWNFVPNWHLKLNYAQGFRSPVFNNTSSNGEGVQLAGNPNLKLEHSDAAQAEVNARIYKGERRIRELSFRIDGSYTRLDNLIQINQGQYKNSGQRGIASAEFLGKLFIQGGHRIELAYTWMQIDTADRGILRTNPEHWFSLATVFTLAKNLTLTTNLKIVGAMEDANRLVEYRDTTYSSTGTVMNPVTVAATDLVVDRIPPQADLGIGLTWLPVPKLMLRATVFDALFAHSYYSDATSDYEPHVEYMPNPIPGFRGYVSAMFQY